MPNPIRVAVVGPYPLLVEGIIQTIRRYKDLEMIAGGANLWAISDVLQRGQVDVLIVDNSTPAVEALLEPIKRRVGCTVLVLAALDDPTTALARGANEYVRTGVNGTDLVSAIKRVHAGRTVVTTELASKIAAEPLSGPICATPLQMRIRPHASLDYREQQILHHVSEGLSNKEIANLLGVTLGTVKMYIYRAYKKMRVRNRVGAIQAWNKHRDVS
jgi:DNA-binding NarL/FixJ family response regulator